MLRFTSFTLGRTWMHLLMIICIIMTHIVFPTPTPTTAQERTFIPFAPAAQQTRLCSIAVTVCEDTEHVIFGQVTSSTFRDIVINWSGTSAPIGTYSVYRQNLSSGGSEIFLKNVSPIADSALFAASLDSTTLENLQLAFSDDGVTPISEAALHSILTTIDDTTPMTDTIKARIAVQRYPQLAEVLGLQVSDSISTDLTSTYRYRIVAVVNGLEGDDVGVVTVHPDTKGARLPVPIVSEAKTYDGPPNVGLIDSKQPTTVPERFDESIMQNERSNHGKAFLVWSEGAPVGPTNRIVVGYNVKRQMGSLFEQLNDEPISINSSTLFTTTVTTAEGTFSASVDDQYYFVDDELWPASFGVWSYVVCPVDIAGAEGPCSKPVKATKRELVPPDMSQMHFEVTPIYPTPPSSGAATIKISWSYFDIHASGYGKSPQFFVTRALTTGLELSKWTPIGKPITAINSFSVGSYIIYDTPPLNTTYWYRIQVRDNAGNWSAPSEPVKGAIFDRTPPAAPTLAKTNTPCYSTLPARLSVPSDVTQAVLYRRLSLTGEWRIVKRFRPNGTGSSRGVDLIDRYMAPQANTTVYYQLTYQDAYGNVSTPSQWCVTMSSSNELVPPRFTTEMYDNEGNAPRTVRLDFGQTSDNDTRSVVVNRPNTLKSSNLITSTVSNSATTFDIKIDPGESLRVGAYSSALTMTTDISSTLNSRWLRNVNNFLNLDDTIAADVFSDVPRHMTDLGFFNITWGSSNDEGCRDTRVPVRKVCVWLDNSKGYLIGERPPPIALFRRIAPTSVNYAPEEVPWLQVSNITSWRNINRRWVVEDNSYKDPNQTYEYMAVAHSANSYEAIGYFKSRIIVPIASKTPPTQIVRIGDPVNMAGWQTALPKGCMLTGKKPTAGTITVNEANQASLPPGLFNSGSLSNDIDLGNDWSFTVESVIRSLNTKSCVITTPSASNSGLYVIGTLYAGGTAMKSSMVLYNVTLNGAGGFVNTRFFAPLIGGSNAHIGTGSGNGVEIDLVAYTYQVNATGVMTATTAMFIELPKHIKLTYDTKDISESINSANTVLLFSNDVDGNFGSSSLGNTITSNVSYSPNPAAGVARVGMYDNYTPWLYRLNGRLFIPEDLSMLAFDEVEAKSILTYTPPSFASGVPDNNMGFVGYTGVTGRDYTYTSLGSFGVNMAGTQAASLLYTQPIAYVTAYPAGIAIKADAGATVSLTDSIISGGALTSPTLALSYAKSDTDTSYARVNGGQAKLVNANFLPIERGSFYQATYARNTLTIDLSGSALQFDAAGLVTKSITTTDKIEWTGFSFTPNPADLDMNLYLAPVTPIGMSSYAPTLPKTVESPWEQIDLSRDDLADLDPGINFVGDATVAYGCYGNGEFAASMDAYLRYGGYSEHLIFSGLSGDSIKNKVTGYDETLTKFSAIFADNLIVDPSDILSTLVLPYPSDVTLPLKATTFSGAGCPVGGEIGEPGIGLDLNHKYWNFDQTAMTFGYTTASMSKYALQYSKTHTVTLATALTALPPMILQLSGVIRPLAARDENGDAGEIPAVSEWLPDGDYGNIILTEPTEAFVSGMPFTTNDVLLNRYHKMMLKPGDKPDTLGFGASVKGFPAALLDGSGLLSRNSLEACVTAGGGETVGCGIQVMDGNPSLSYFGETEACSSNCIDESAGASGMRTRAAPADPTSPERPKGDGSVGSAGGGGPSSDEGDSLWNPVIVQFVWDHGSTMIDLPFPIVFIANKSGGVMAGMMRGQSVLPGPAELVKTDISVIANGRLDSGVFTTDIGVYFGYAASQAAFRALATHRPNSNNTGFKASASWNDVKDDVKKWAKTFGYGENTGTDDDDAVDMAKDFWEGYELNSKTYTWGDPQKGSTKSSENDYQYVFDFLEPKLKTYGATEKYVDETRGITPLKQGSVLTQTCTTLQNGQGAVAFQFDTNGNFKITEIAFGTYLNIKAGGAGGACGSDTLLKVKRVSLNLNSDGEIIILANGIQSDMISKDTTIDVQLVIGTSSGNQRIEGGIKVQNIEIASVKFSNIGMVFGVGLYSNTLIGYIGFSGGGTFKGVGVTAQFLIGTLPTNSAVLKAQYPGLMNKLKGDKGQGKIYSGLYISVGVSVPIFQEGCMREVIADGEIRGWYLKEASPSTGTIAWGGYLSAGVSGQAACLVSARGQLSLEISMVGEFMTFTGDAWLAGGVGKCEPSTWKNWSGRWWNDSWCAQAGARVVVVYTEVDDTWDVDYTLDVESLW